MRISLATLVYLACLVGDEGAKQALTNYQRLEKYTEKNIKVFAWVKGGEFETGLVVS